MLFDFYQQRTKEGEGQVGSWASNITYDWEMFGTACGLEVDYVGGESHTNTWVEKRLDIVVPPSG